MLQNDVTAPAAAAGGHRELPAEVEALAGSFTDGPLSDSAGLSWWRYQGLRL